MTGSLNRRLLLGGAIGGAAALAGCAAAGPKTAAPAAAPVSVLPPNLFGPKPGVALLSRNENPYGPGPKVMAAVAEATSLGAYYADTSYLANMIAEKNGLKADQVALSTGSGEVLSAAAVAFGKKGAILCPSLFWDTTTLYAANKGAAVKRVPLKPDMSIDLVAMEAAVDASIGLVHICNPNNPTGLLLDGAELRAFCERVSKTTMVLVDEAYNELLDDPAGASVMDLVRAGNPNVIVARTFSKIYGMAGMRIGYAMSTPETCKLLSDHVMSWMSAPSIAAAIASYNDEPFLAFSKDKVKTAREMVLAGLKGVGLSALPSQTNFLYVKVPDAAAFQKKMAEKAVMVRGPYGKLTEWSRVSMGRLEDVERYVKALPEALGA